MTETIDRIAPTRRPEGVRPAQHQEWERLLFLHWRIPVEVLRPLVPAELAIDTFDGDAWVGLVPFTMKNVRLAGLPAVPGTADFHETNVRTYVHHRGAEPGVWFFSLDAAARIPVYVARGLFHLPYHHAEMSIDDLPDGSCLYRTARNAEPPAGCEIRYRPEGSPFTALPGTLEHFLAERYILYADTGEGELHRGRVHHSPYPLQTTRLYDWSESLLSAAMIPRPEGEPLAHYASRVEVEVFSLEPV